MKGSLEGVLGRIVIQIQSPKARAELEDFARDIDRVMKEQGVTRIVTLRKKLAEGQYEVLVIPASHMPQTRQLQVQGYDVSTANDLSQMHSGFKSFDFEQTVQFGEPDQNSHP